MAMLVLGMVIGDGKLKPIVGVYTPINKDSVIKGGRFPIPDHGTQNPWFCRGIAPFKCHNYSGLGSIIPIGSMGWIYFLTLPMANLLNFWGFHI